MDKKAQIKSLLKSIVGANPNYPVRGEILAIDGQTCTVKLAGGLEVSGVRLKPVVSDSENYVLVVPAIGSDVLMLSGNGTLDDLTVILCDSPESIEMSRNGLTVLFDGTDGKVQIKNDATSLKDVFEDLGIILKQLKVSTPSGPSGVPLPDSILAIEQFEIKFKQLLK